MDAPSAEAVRALIEQRRKEHRTTILISHDALPSDRTISIDRHVQTRIAG
jgi:hypothetical protein